MFFGGGAQTAAVFFFAWEAKLSPLGSMLLFEVLHYVGSAATFDRNCFSNTFHSGVLFVPSLIPQMQSNSVQQNTLHPFRSLFAAMLFCAAVMLELTLNYVLVSHFSNTSIFVTERKKKST